MASAITAQMTFLGHFENSWEESGPAWEKEDRMAGIIAQMTRAKRDRDKKKTYVTEKCM